jgi:DNA sulfur modification protein DndB
MLKELSFGLHADMHDLQTRPSDEILEESYHALAKRIEELLDRCASLRATLQATSNAKDVRAPKGKESEGHALMRPVVQKAIVRVVRAIIDQDLLTWEEVLDRLSLLSWEISQPPWIAVFNPANSKMITAKENTQLLEELIRVHLAPLTKAEINRARRAFREIRQKQYPISAEDLEAGIVSVPEEALSEEAL